MSKKKSEETKETKAAAVAESEAPIAGLKPGRIVHTLDGGVLKAGIVAQVHDDVSGEITIRVQEPSGPTRPVRLQWAGAGAELAEGTWQWMYDGQATDRAKPAAAASVEPPVRRPAIAESGNAG